MDLNEILKLFANLFNNQNQNNNLNFKDFNKQTNLEHNSNNTNQEKHEHSTNEFNNNQTQNPYINFPPPLNEKINNQKVNANYYQAQNNIYPQNYSNEQSNNLSFNTNTPPQKQQENPSQPFNIQNLLSNFLSNPDSLKLIQQFLPLLQNQNSSNNGNILSNLLSGFKKNKNQSSQAITLSENQENDNDLDIDKLIRIDDI